MFSLSIISCKAIFCPLSFDRYHENAGAGIKKKDNLTYIPLKANEAKNY